MIFPLYLICKFNMAIQVPLVEEVIRVFLVRTVKLERQEFRE